MEHIGYTLAQWADGDWDVVDKADADGKLFGIMIVQDQWGRPVRSEMTGRQPVWRRMKNIWS